jgi:hypothetical protein
MKSSHLTVFFIPNLPTKAKEGYIIPGLNKNLISVTKLCDHSCKVLFSRNECIVMHNNLEVIRGKRSKRNGLWYIPLIKTHGAQNITIVDDTKANLHEGNSAFHTSTMAETITFSTNASSHQPSIHYAKPSIMTNLSVFHASLQPWYKNTYLNPLPHPKDT